MRLIHFILAAGIKISYISHSVPMGLNSVTLAKQTNTDKTSAVNRKNVSKQNIYEKHFAFQQ